ncbi:MAG: hypothetical protein CH6_2269 [Candidatus Kapaibacterium sp.]|nr:MAG: hypothetical protein CH6_2269 [Candidatus Kapabacteria bacterium]
MLNSKVAIVGCGVAGISASLELTKNGVPHTIFEAKNFIGGRFYSFFDKELGFEIDNGQHFFSLAYKNFFELLEQLDTKSHVEKVSKIEIPFFSKEFGLIPFEEKIFKGKLSLLFGILNFRLLPFKQRINLLRLLLKIILSKNFPKNINTQKYLLQQNQEQIIIDKFWNPIAVSIFNNSIDCIPTEIFFNIFKIALLGKSNQIGFTYSKVPQSLLFVNFQDRIKPQGQLLLATAVKKIQKNSAMFELETNSNQKFYFEKVILCVQPNVLKKILPEEWLINEYFRFLDFVQFNPILSIFITTNEEITPKAFGFLDDSPFHWIFNKTQMFGLPSPPYHYSFTTSNAKDLVSLSQTRIIELLEQEIFKFFRKKINIIACKVIKDKFATVALDSYFFKYRPEQVSPVDGLFIAGDWTQTNLPATLESAALSSKLAVSKMLKQNGDI